jgi:hypothetical protein
MLANSTGDWIIHDDNLELKPLLPESGGFVAAGAEARTPKRLSADTRDDVWE